MSQNQNTPPMTDKSYVDTFQIEFSTQDMPGKIVATEVRLSKRIMGPADSARIDLADHPLYPKLFQYCMRNPPRGVKVKKK